jgi:hypothetical protein
VGAGMVLRDDDNQVIFSARHQLTDPLKAEARACEEGLTFFLRKKKV